MDNLEREIKKIRNLKQNQGKSEEELQILAKEKLEKQDILGSLTFALPEELNWAKNLLENYLKESSLISTAEKDTLKQLIDLEILLERIKKHLGTEYSKANPTIPVQMVGELNKLNELILNLKDRLGLTQKEEQKTVLDEWNKLKAKALAHYKESAKI